MTRVIIAGAGEGRHLHKENLCLSFRWIRGGKRTLPSSIDFQLPFAQNNPHAKVAYSWVANPDPLQEENEGQHDT